MIKIFINNIPIYLAAHSTEHAPNQDKAVLKVIYRDRNELLNTLHYIETNAELQAVYILGNTLAQVKADFFSFYQLVLAAGGVVLNSLSEVLLIYRNQRWDLPKGKIEPGEGVETAALREVEEETGIGQLSLLAPIQLPHNQGNVTYHTFYQRGKRILKATHWYKMQCANHHEMPLQPQSEEGITKAIWAPLADLQEPEYRQHTYGSILDVLQAIEER